ncbi:MAG: HEAT repeat domain-containing protein [Elusimicrobiota bacterium]|jgi:HEAT repeat protein
MRLSLFLLALCLQPALYCWAAPKNLLDSLKTADEQQRPLILRALGRSGGRAGRDALLKLFDVDAGPPEQNAIIARSLGKLGGADAEKRLLEAWERLQKLKFRSQNLPPQAAHLRSEVLAALAECGGPASLPAMRRGLIDDDDAAVIHALEGLSRLKDAQSIDGMIRLLDSPRPDIVQASFEALSSFKLPEVELELRRRVDTGGSRIKILAAYCLARQNVKIGLLVLEGFLEEVKGGYPEGVLASYYLGKLGRPEGPAYLMRIADEDSSELRPLAMEALGKIGDRRLVSKMTARWENESREMRILIAQSLGRLGGKNALRTLRLMQDDPVREVSWSARLALSELGEYEAP